MYNCVVYKIYKENRCKTSRIRTYSLIRGVFNDMSGKKLPPLSVSVGGGGSYGGRNVCIVNKIDDFLD